MMSPCEHLSNVILICLQHTHFRTVELSLSPSILYMKAKKVKKINPEGPLKLLVLPAISLHISTHIFIQSHTSTQLLLLSNS